ncbi:hypothetical protein K491DRAFT_136901 [Lophiostoma macrostomum CBS 122681]|uniref:Uncharacterized protein n=1 Tax=Lophiostoma macrostomum CBS 122681 TaxID=1314788 RepID=A0A6A6TK69_9PLEO|nr:hypothetical protein K491DRAFT_136901 [Lophiostoma macrostomum CBS 122681]
MAVAHQHGCGMLPLAVYCGVLGWRRHSDPSREASICAQLSPKLRLDRRRFECGRICAHDAPWHAAQVSAATWSAHTVLLSRQSLNTALGRGGVRRGLRRCHRAPRSPCPGQHGSERARRSDQRSHMAGSEMLYRPNRSAQQTAGKARRASGRSTGGILEFAEVVRTWGSVGTGQSSTVRHGTQTHVRQVPGTAAPCQTDVICRARCRALGAAETNQQDVPGDGDALGLRCPRQALWRLHLGFEEVGVSGCSRRWASCPYSHSWTRIWRKICLDSSPRATQSQPHSNKTSSHLAVLPSLCRAQEPGRKFPLYVAVRIARKRRTAPAALLRLNPCPGCLHRFLLVLSPLYHTTIPSSRAQLPSCALVHTPGLRQTPDCSFCHRIVIRCLSLAVITRPAAATPER